MNKRIAWLSVPFVGIGLWAADGQSGDVSGVPFKCLAATETNGVGNNATEIMALKVG